MDLLSALTTTAADKTAAAVVSIWHNEYTEKPTGILPPHLGAILLSSWNGYLSGTSTVYHAGDPEAALTVMVGILASSSGVGDDPHGQINIPIVGFVAGVARVRSAYMATRIILHSGFTKKLPVWIIGGLSVDFIPVIVRGGDEAA